MIALEKLVSSAHQDDIRRLVVAAVIVQEERVLIVRRKSNDFLGGLWELPSGRVEQDESLPHALTREVDEEVGLEISNDLHYLGRFDYESKSGVATRQFNFRVQPIEFSGVTLSEHDQYRWISFEDISSSRVSKEVAVAIELGLIGYLPMHIESSSD